MYGFGPPWLGVGYGSSFLPLNKKYKKVIATFYLTFQTFFTELWDVNSQLRIIKSKLWDINSQFWKHISRPPPKLDFNLQLRVYKTQFWVYISQFWVYISQFGETKSELQKFALGSAGPQSARTYAMINSLERTKKYVIEFTTFLKVSRCNQCILATFKQRN